jgi:hypothetical protein
LCKLIDVDSLILVFIENCQNDSQELIVDIYIQFFEHHDQLIDIDAAIAIRFKSLEQRFYSRAWSLIDVGCDVLHSLFLDSLAHGGSIVYSCHDGLDLDVFDISLHFSVTCDSLQRQVISHLNTNLLEHTVKLDL